MLPDPPYFPALLTIGFCFAYWTALQARGVNARISYSHLASFSRQFVGAKTNPRARTGFEFVGFGPSSFSLLLSFEAVISESLKSSFGLSFPSISLQIRTKRGKKLSCIRALMSRNSYQMGSFVLRRKLPFFHSSISRNPNYHTFFLSIRSFYWT